MQYRNSGLLHKRHVGVTLNKEITIDSKIPVVAVALHRLFKLQFFKRQNAKSRKMIFQPIHSPVCIM